LKEKDNKKARLFQRAVDNG